MRMGEGRKRQLGGDEEMLGGNRKTERVNAT